MDEPIEVLEAGYELEYFLPVVVYGRRFVVEEVQALQVLEVFQGF